MGCDLVLEIFGSLVGWLCFFVVVIVLFCFLIISGCFFISLARVWRRKSVWQDNIWGKTGGLTSQNVPIAFPLKNEHIGFTKDKWAEESDDQTEKYIPSIYSPECHWERQQNAAKDFWASLFLEA